MAQQRKLSDKEERDVALSYLCGVSKDYIQERWNVSPATLTANIIGKRSYGWDDPLVEFYRQTDLNEKLKNSAHFKLAFHGIEIQRSELVSKQRDGNVNIPINEDIYHPRIERLVEDIALDKYMSAVADSKTALIYSIFGYPDLERIVQPILLDRLVNAYHLMDKFSLDRVFKDVEDEIVCKVKQGGFAMTPNKSKLLDEALETLDSREIDIISYYFGLNKPSLTLEEIGSKFNLGGERIRQIKETALRRLRHPSRSERIKILAGLATDDDVEKYQVKLKDAKERDAIERKTHSQLKIEDALKIHISELDLSVRSYNCLRAANLFSVEDIIKKTPEELLRYKNMGRRSVREIQKVLSKVGVNLKQESCIDN